SNSSQISDNITESIFSYQESSITIEGTDNDNNDIVNLLASSKNFLQNLLESE
ncbi:4562_t:CDS:2, partial [Scutellospora calospora]